MRWAIGFPLVFLCASAAHADWRSPRWNDNESAVMAAVPDAKEIPPKDRAKKSGNYGEARLTFDAESGRFRFDGVFSFHSVSGGLVASKLNARDPRQCVDIYDSLRIRYGLPTEYRDVNGVMTVVWFQSDTTVNWAWVRGDAALCFISYSSRATPETEGFR